LGEAPEFAEAASELASRGFDTVIFGHTHHAGQVNLEEGRQYFNSGSWLISNHYIEILKGHVTLREWKNSTIS
jgi:UDP-2,3-diacylglucosamine pyrophosphatase LpxH